LSPMATSPTMPSPLSLKPSSTSLIMSVSSDYISSRHFVPQAPSCIRYPMTISNFWFANFYQNQLDNATCRVLLMLLKNQRKKLHLERRSLMHMLRLPTSLLLFSLSGPSCSQALL
jgi:hypothetical protein